MVAERKRRFQNLLLWNRKGRLDWTDSSLFWRQVFLIYFLTSGYSCMFFTVEDKLGHVHAFPKELCGLFSKRSYLVCVPLSFSFRKQNWEWRRPTSLTCLSKVEIYLSLIGGKKSFTLRGNDHPIKWNLKKWGLSFTALRQDRIWDLSVLSCFDS